MIKEDHTNSTKNNTQNTEAFTSKCSAANFFLKILTQLPQNSCEEARFLGDLHIKNLNF